MFLSSDGASTRGDRPFLDRLDVKSLATERMFRSDKNDYDQFPGFAGEPGKYLTWHQSVKGPPNAFVRVLGARNSNTVAGEANFASSGNQLTRLADPTPEVRRIKKRLVTYKRADGMDLSFTLYTPPGYKEGTRVPAVLYAYR